MLIVKATIRSKGEILTVKGRDAWALLKLQTANENGCTSLDHPGPRWSGYVYNLRKAGFPIETVKESHGGPFPGRHARYILQFGHYPRKERERTVMAFAANKKGAGGECIPSATSTGSGSRTITDGFPGQEAHRVQTP